MEKDKKNLKNPEELLPPQNTDVLLAQILENNNDKMSEGNIIAENSLMAQGDTNKLLENNVEASGEILGEAKKTNETLEKMANKEVQNVRLVPEKIDDDASSELAKVFWEMLRGRKGEKGDKGDKGDMPGKEEIMKYLLEYIPDEKLIELISPLIPDAIPGHTPTSEELLSLIRPLVPEKGEDGETPSDEKLLDLIRSIMPKAEKGDKGDKGDTPKIDYVSIIKGLKGKISWEDISGKPNFETFLGRQSSRTVSLQELDNVDLTGLSFVDGKYVLGSGTGSGFNFETPVGAINGSNNIFTVSNIPKGIVLNGSWYFENDGYTLSGLTVTLVLTPDVGSTLRSAY